MNTQYYTIRKSITGGWLISMPCPITGRREDAHISAICGIEHIHSNAKALTRGRTSAQEVAIIVEDRMNRALAIRAKRNRDKAYQQEVFDTIDCGMLPTVGQLRRAGMLPKNFTKQY